MGGESFECCKVHAHHPACATLHRGALLNVSSTIAGLVWLG